jgi:YbgC/YbaW family acyl-CoA thioester hydrolase
MQSTLHTYPVLIKEANLDTFGHVNNAMYLVLLEEARWDLLTGNGYGLDKIMSTRIGPTILEINLRFLRELKLRDEIIIETRLVSYEKKIGIIEHKILRGTELCCTAQLTLALFDLNLRKIIPPTPEWLKGIGVES